jgi:hypothetical protein
MGAQNGALLTKHKDQSIGPQLALVAGLLAIAFRTTCNTLITLNMEAIFSSETSEPPSLLGVQTLKNN